MMQNQRQCPLKLDEFYNYRFLSNLSISPKGTRAAFAVGKVSEDKKGYDSNLWIFQDGQASPLTSSGKEGIYIWDGDDLLLFSSRRNEADQKRAANREEFTVFYRISTEGGEAQRAFELPVAAERIWKAGEGRYGILASIDASCPDAYLFSKEEREKSLKEKKEEEDYLVFDELPFWLNGAGVINKSRTALFIYEEKENRLRRITGPWESVEDLVLDGETFYFTLEEFQTKRTRRQKIASFSLNTGEYRTLYDKGEYAIQKLEVLREKESPGRLIVYATRSERFGLNENGFFYEWDPESKDLTLLLATEETVGSSVGSDCRLGGGREVKAWQDKLYLISTKRNASILCVMGREGLIPVTKEEGSVDCFDINPVTGEILFIGMQEGRLQEIYSLGEEGKTSRLTDINTEALRGKYVAKYEKLTVTSTWEGQNFDIDGWVLKPADFDEKKTYPAILDIHGGPKTVYGEVFYHEMQYWAGQGYFVFFCNPVGGDGRGNEFADIRGKYGTVDYQNLMDFTDAVLAAYPQIDKKRLAVTGGSYGGFMTNWIIGHTDRFACAATQRSISNWLSFWGVSDIGPYFSQDQIQGDIKEQAVKFWDHSPLKYWQNVNTPTLFIHSDEDYRCPLEQGIQLYTALLEKGVPARMCVFKGENHELSRSGRPLHRSRRLKEITQWIDKYTAAGEER